MLPDRYFNSDKISQILFDNKILTAPGSSPKDIIDRAEFQLLKHITENVSISVESLEAKYQTSISISMLLSNLQADRLIEQTADYKWKLSDWWTKKIDEIKEIEISSSQQSVDKSNVREIELVKNRRKAEFKQLANGLEGYSFLPINYRTIEDLLQVPELEALHIITKTGAATSEDIEQNMEQVTSVSMILSNLQADELIKQNDSYQWVLEESFVAKLAGLTIEIKSDQEEEVRKSSTEFGDKEAEVLQNRQLLQALEVLNYFKGFGLREIIETPEFRILNVINLHSPIITAEIDHLIEIDSSLSMMISNLSADNMITEVNDAWIIGEELRAEINRTKISRDEILQVLSKQKPDNISTQNETSMDHAVSLKPVEKEEKEIEQPAPITQPETHLYKPDDASIDSLILQLKKNGYIESTSLPTSELEKIPEYNLLLLLRESGPLTPEEIENQSVGISVSLTLSNLSADGLIKQNNEFKYSVTDLIRRSATMTKRTASTTQTSQGEVSGLQAVGQDRVKKLVLLKLACQRVGYIKDEKEPDEILMNSPEYQVLKTIMENEGITSNQIKAMITSRSPVLVSRTISKLEADQRITSRNEVFEFTAEFETFLIKDDFEAQKKKEQKERDRLKHEEGEIKRNREEKLQELADQLLGEGYIKSSSSTPSDLMQIPEFEILVIILENGSVSVQEIKSKTKSVSPVLVSRTITKLEADEKIKRSDDGKWHLVE